MSFDSAQTLKVSDFAKVKGGKRMPAGTALTPQRSKHPYLRIVDFKDGGIDNSNLQYVPDEVFPQIARYVISDRDIYISIVGTIGLVGAVPKELSGANLTENAAKICEIDESRVSAKYLAYYLRSEVGQAAIKAITVGSTQPKLALFRIDQIEVPCPPLFEQKGIAALLSALDDRITLLRETNATLEAIAQALFKSWFVDFDPVRAKMEGRAPEGMIDVTAALFPDSFEESELGLVPRGWRVGSLADLSELNPESWTVRNQPANIAYVDLANAKDNEISAVTEFVFADAPSRARRVLRSGDTIVGTVRPGNRSFAFIHDPVRNLTGSTGFAVLRPSAVEHTEFVFLAATQDTSIEHLAHVADGGAYPAVRPDVVAGLPCVIPSVEVLRKFHEAAELLLAKASANKKQAQTLATLRDTLLPRLISGQLRLPEAQAQLEEMAT